jgi:uncharacterized protein YbjT (DUF2867 family)
MRVLVTGSTGYLGRPAVAALQRAGHTVVALERPGSARSWGNSAPLARAVADITDTSALAAAMAGCDAVVHLVGIIREFPRRGVTMQRMHVEAAQAVAEVARRAGVPRIVYVSALGARQDAPALYHRTKWAAEEAVRQSPLEWTILRPSVIVGRGGPGPNFTRQLAGLIQRAPIVPVIGDGTYPLQPVHVETVTAAIVRCVEEPRFTSFDLAGPHTLSYAEMLARIAHALGRPLRTVRVPLRLMRRVVRWLERFPAFPLTSDQLAMLTEGNACAPGAAEAAWAALGIDGRPVTDDDLLASL